MPAFTAIVMRCLLGLALVVNGALVPAHAHADVPVQASADVAAEGGMPCHDSGDADAGAGDPQPGDPERCCGSQCVCGCVFTSMGPTLAPLAAVDVPDSMLASMIASALVEHTFPRLLRPPIA